MLNGQTIEDLTSVMEFDRNGRGVFLPYVANTLCLIPENYEQAMISDTLDSMISDDSSYESTPVCTPVCTTDTGSMSSVFSVSCCLCTFFNPLVVMDRPDNHVKTSLRHHTYRYDTAQ